MPAGQVLHHGLCSVQCLAHGEAGGSGAVAQLVSSDHGDLVHVVQHVQQGQGDLVAALAEYAVAACHQVDGADAAGSAGLRAVLRARVAQLLRPFAEPLADERALSHAGRVRLHHAHDLVELRRGKARADRRIRRNGVRRGGVGIDAVVQVAQRAELGFKEDGLSLLLRVSQETAGVGDVGLDGAAVGVDPRHELVHRVALCAVDLLEHQVLPLKKVGKVLL